MPLPEPLTALLSPDAYAHPAADIRLIETHISWVILAGEFAYKLRRPVNLGFLDFSDPERRHQDCRDEVRLNRRGCTTLYLGVVPITRAAGRVVCDGRGEVLDWAVRMRRLPQERMLASLLETGAVTFDMLGRLLSLA
ncbi:MAG: hypothetical protein FJ191_08945 [Gammaproteobacteria bacterium]|nr:hypothetical protein [Gammaproteobacteria bacterium]